MRGAFGARMLMTRVWGALVGWAVVPAVGLWALGVGADAMGMVGGGGGPLCCVVSLLLPGASGWWCGWYVPVVGGSGQMQGT